MKKMMFSDKYGLTQAVLDGKKTQTRRNFTMTLHKKTNNEEFMKQVYPDKVFYEDNTWKFSYKDKVYILPKENLPKYNIGEVVAIAQSYQDTWKINPDAYHNPFFLKGEKGWTNKMFVKADKMSHQIKITNIRCEKLQDISEEDCLKEGIYKGQCGSADTHFMDAYYIPKYIQPYCTAKGAYSELIDKINKKGTWDENNFVWVYDFELVK